MRKAKQAGLRTGQSFSDRTALLAAVCRTAVVGLCYCKPHASEPKSLWKNTRNSKEERALCCNAELSSDTSDANYRNALKMEVYVVSIPI